VKRGIYIILDPLTENARDATCWNGVSFVWIDLTKFNEKRFSRSRNYRDQRGKWGRDRRFLFIFSCRRRSVYVYASVRRLFRCDHYERFHILVRVSERSRL